MKQDHANMSVHNTLIQKLDDEQLEGSGFVFQYIVDIIKKYIKLMIFKFCNSCLIPSIDETLRCPEFNARHCGSLLKTAS